MGVNELVGLINKMKWIDTHANSGGLFNSKKNPITI
jgi:hypothetical protein